MKTGGITLFNWWKEEVAPRERFLDECAALYFARCDAYDAYRCSGVSSRTGEPLPANGEELAAINRNAMQVIDDIVATCPITRPMLMRAISAYGQRE